MQGGYTPLIIAVENDNKEIAKLLLSHGANIEAENQVNICVIITNMTL
jgi:ankyrin repeat protein